VKKFVQAKEKPRLQPGRKDQMVSKHHLQATPRKSQGASPSDSTTASTGLSRAEARPEDREGMRETPAARVKEAAAEEGKADINVRESQVPQSRPSGKEILALRTRFRLVPEHVAGALGIERSELLKLEDRDRFLPARLVPLWRALATYLEKAKGHIRRAPMKDFPFPRPTCEACHLTLHFAGKFRSQRLDQDLYRFICSTSYCSRRCKIVSVDRTGQRVTPRLRPGLPFDRPACRNPQCERPLVWTREQDHPKLGKIYRFCCNNPACSCRYQIHWFDQRGRRVLVPGRTQLDLPMKREVCANCRRPKTVTRKLHKPSGRYLWLQQCRRQGCPGTTSWYGR